MRAFILVGLTLLPAPTPGAVQRPTAPELDRAGWNALGTNRLEEAADAFREALQLDARNARLLLGAGLTAHLRARSDEARQYLTAALQIQPALNQASRLLGQILYSEGDLAGAIHAYEQALVHAPDDAFLGGRVEAWRREAELHEGFAQRVGDHFTVLFEGPREEGLAARALDLLEAAYWRIGTALGAYPNGIVTVVLYPNEQFRDITQSPSWAVAAFDGRIRVPMRGALESPSELERVLAHEFTHALVRSLAPRGVPQWLNEGLAQYFEPGARRNARDVLAATSGGHDTGRGLIPLARLEDTFDGLDARQARLAYTQSALAAQALVDLAGLTGVLNLLSYVGQGMPFSEAFERAAFVSYAEFDRTWAERVTAVPHVRPHE